MSSMNIDQKHNQVQDSRKQDKKQYFIRVVLILRHAENYKKKTQLFRDLHHPIDPTIMLI